MISVERDPYTSVTSSKTSAIVIETDGWVVPEYFEAL